MLIDIIHETQDMRLFTNFDYVFKIYLITVFDIRVIFK